MSIDRADYSNHLRETNKEQLLLNIVALRHGDMPLFLEVSSVIAQYTREGSVHADIAIKPGPDADDAGGIGGNVLLRETPTITYTPVTGENLARNLFAPLPPASLLGIMEAGWSADLLFRLSARSINGVLNGSRDPMFEQKSDPRFEQVLAALGRLQRSRAIVMSVTHNGEAEFAASAQFAPDLDAGDRADLDYLIRTLHLPAKRGSKLRITFAAAQSAPDELAIGTRSMFEILSELAQGVDSGNAAPTGLIHVQSGPHAPPDSYVSGRYRGRWYWIDRNDGASTRLFLVTQVLLSLNGTSASANAPLVTIPTG
jgi:hypothetical protein